MYLRYLRGQFPDVLPDRHFATGLVRALAVQVVFELGDAGQHIEEMAGLCDELLNSDVSRESLTLAIMSFLIALRLRFVGLIKGHTISEKVINCLRKATLQIPDLHNTLLILAMLLSDRFRVTLSGDDYEEGMAILDKILNFRDPGGMLSPHHDDALVMTATFAMMHFHVYGKPEYLEQAIYRLRTFLDRTRDSPEHACCPPMIEVLSMLHRWRHYDANVKTNPHDARSSTPGFIKPPLFRDLIAGLPELRASTPRPFLWGLRISHGGPGNSHEGPYDDPLEGHRNALRNIDRLTDISDIEDGIEYCRQLNVSYPDSSLACEARSNLARFFRRAFECTNEFEYLNKAISAARDHINSPDPLVSRVFSLHNLIAYLSFRLLRLRHREDLSELMQLFPTASKYECGRLHHQELVSVRWASIAHRFGHPSALAAYDHAMSSMQVYLTLAPTLDKQHSRLVVLNDDIKRLPLDCASYQMSTCRPEEAIETLERGRALLWSEMRGLRTTVGQISSTNRHLAERFAAVSRDLETLTLALDNADGGNGVPQGMDAFGHLVMRQQKLLDEREKLIFSIQALPGCDTFLKPHPYDTLRGAACQGPIIIINHSGWRSDIVILLHNSPPSPITTSDDFYARANELQDRLLAERPQPGSGVLEWNEYNDALSSVLKELYELVGRPVIKRLDELNVPLQSRVWWCPTSVFCSLPLHAMGPIPSDGGRPQYFLDLYIPSYIPSLLSLIESRKSGSQTFDKPSMLVVAQPDLTMMQALEEVRVVRAVSPRVTTLVSAAATPPAVLECIQDHQFVHIVSHGILESGKPLDSGFKLYEGQRLSLFDVVRSRLPNAEFAFLAACHTAELTDQSPADEVLHLAAAMQFCGFRSVVGTMWAMADDDGPALAGYFYKSVFSGKKQEGVYYYERTAEALRDAVVKLRRKRGVTLERWVNYVHFGA